MMTEHTRVLLLVEDNPADAMIVEEMLSPRADSRDLRDLYTVLHADRAGDAIDALQRSRVDLVLLDLRLPDAKGAETVRRLHSAAHDVPIIVLTGMDDEELGLICIGEGAQDFLRKDEIAPRTLRRSIGYAMLRSQSLQLAVRNREMSEASRMKSEFLASMSHELRTPLNAIVGFTELLVDGRVDMTSPTGTEFLSDILTSARHLQRLIDDILDLAKVEAGKMTFRAEPVVLEELVTEVAHVVRGLSDEKDIRVTIEADPTLQGIVLDPLRFKQVLYNYLSNAIKFTRSGGTIVVRTLPESAQMFRLEVEDEGIGIAPNDLSRLFMAYEQLEGVPRAVRIAGTGLGLALTRRLVEAQAGFVGATSERGHGAVFHAVLPRVPLDRPEDA